MDGTAIGQISQLAWVDFAQAIRRAPKSYLPMRLDVLRRARDLFGAVDSFGELDDTARRSLGGIVGRRQASVGGIGQSWHIFGAMTGAGCFKNRMNANDPHIAAALDQLPQSGPITSAHYARYVEGFTKAFEGMKKTGGISTASRLLAMKRPDYFVCVTKKNRPRLAKLAAAELTIASYWSSLIEPLRATAWWQSERPVGDDCELWEGRMALLDVLCHIE